MGKSELVLYQPDSTVSVEVRLEDENVWLNRQQIAVLFDRDIKTVGKHINNALNEELAVFSTVAKFATTAVDGKVYQVEYYSLDVILSAGYRVKSSRGIKCLLSNSNTKYIRELYNHDIFDIISVQAKRKINSDSDGRGAVNEVLIKNWKE